MSNLFSTGGAGNVGFSGEVQQSLKFNDDESQYLSWTPASAGNRKTWTWSGWVKRGNLGATQGIFASDGTSDTTLFEMFFSGGDQLGAQGSSSTFFRTTQLFRDTSAWYHIVLKWDAANTNADLYVNGVEVTSWSTAPSPSNQDYGINNNVEHYIGSRDGGANPFDGYLSNIHFIDGQALDASSFGQFTNGYWEKKDYAGTYGTNGFHLTFQDDVVSEGFNCITYLGNGGTQSLSGLGMAADLVWIKERSSTSGHVLTDTVRGVNKHLVSSSSDAETTVSNGLTSFDADGFSVGSNGAYNQSGQTYVAWCWDAGSGSAASNTDGTITSTVKANPDYGFSIASYVGTGANATFGHGLSSAPELLIVRRTDSAANWTTGLFPELGNGKYLKLNTIDDEIIASNVWNSISPTSTTVSIGTSSATNLSGANYIAYCFAEVANYSSFGTYSGNGSTSGPTVTTGFLPAFLLIKRTDVADNWHIADNTRSTDGTFNDVLRANLANAESENTGFNITYNNTGFTLASTNSELNASGGTYIYMAFADTREAAFWKDVSGQGNHWTPNNLDYRDSLPDSPANSFAVLNPLYSSISASYPTPALSEGNLAASTSSGSNWKTVPSTMYMSTGKWYAEVKVTYTDAVDSFIGFASSEFNGQNYAPSETAFGYQFHPSLGIRHNSTQLAAATFTQNDIIGLALNIDDNEIKFYKNGSLLYTATSVAAGSWSVALTLLYTKTLYANFGQDSTFAGRSPMGAYTDDSELGTFQYAPPTGYLALCTANLPTPTIIDGTEYFNTVLYTGNGSTQSITGVGFGSAPDFVWIKERSSTSGHILHDSVRGAGEYLSSHSTAAEATSTTQVTSFDADGFTTGASGGTNQSGQTYAAWNWLAGGAAVSNTDGSIASQVSANPTAGFSIVSYTGTGSNATVGHGLGVAPSMVIVKNRGGAYSWLVYHKNMAASNPATFYMSLNQNSAASSGANVWINDPTSTVFTVSGSYSEVNSGSNNYIAYCFANTDGYLKAGSYTGNGSTDGPYIPLGFQPSWILIKKSSATGDWVLHDTVRDSFNPSEDRLYANKTDAEIDAIAWDSVSNGFKIRNTSSGINTNGATHIFLAFAETPFKYANAR